MTDKRFDNRTKSTFKKDIKFGTMVEKYFFDKWVSICNSRNDIVLSNVRDNGVGNDGEYVETGTNTAGADFMVDIDAVKDLPLEMKWVPTAGKFTLKVNDLKAYIKEDAAILFIYNSVNCGTNLKKPKDYNLENYIELIESKANQLKWGIMWPDTVDVFLQTNMDMGNIQKIPYMGGKPGIILKQQDFDLWFKQEQF
tara:strand:+ start:1250 stop:1840 length:591 start_codon:yes stop_codon:yes gene_type:complete